MLLEGELISFGLSPREAQAYLTLLRCVEAPASTLAKRLGLPRLGVYATLERLCEMNLITFYEKRGVRIYTASSPRAFLSHCDDQLSTIQARRQRVEQVIPKLNAYMESAGTSYKEGRLRFLSDRFSFKSACLSALGRREDWVVVHDGTLNGIVAEIQRESGVKPLCMVPYSQKRRFSQTTYAVEVRFVPDHCFTGPLNFMITGGKVFFMMEEVSDCFAIEIDSVAVAARLRSVLMLIWQIEFFRL